MLQMSYGQVDRLAKLIPNHPTDPWTLERSLNGVSELAAEYKDDAEVRRLFDLAMKLEGLPRHASTHAAGVVIGDRPLDELVPLYRDPRSDMPVTQFDMKYVEAAGLVKFDFLGLKTLSVLEGRPAAARRAGHRGRFRRAAVGRSGGLRAAPARRHGRRVPARIRRHAADAGGGPPDRLRRHHRARRALPARARWTTSRCSATARTAARAIEYPHPLLEGILAETYGIFVYQEQVMQAAQMLAGYSLGEADLLRRAMGKKIQVGDGRAARPLRRGLRDAQPDPRGQGQRAVRLDRQVRRLRLQQEPRRGLCAGRLPDRLAEGAPPRRILCRLDELRHGADRQARHLRRGHAPAAASTACRPTSTPATPSSRSRTARVRYALGALKGVGEKAMEALVEERERSGPFASLEDFAARIDPRLLNRRQLESLAGARRVRLHQAGPAGRVRRGRDDPRPCRERARRSAISGQAGLFGASSAEAAPIRLPRDASWTLAQRMAAERDAFGFYFSAHPVDAARHLLAAHKVQTFAELAELQHRRGRTRRRDHGGAGRGRALARRRPRAAAT